MPKVDNGTITTALIPVRPHKRCPEKSFGCSGEDCNRPQTCFCEEHCGWEVCRVFEYPEECLTEVKSVWVWNSKKQFWAAQLGGIRSQYIVRKSLDNQSPFKVRNT